MADVEAKITDRTRAIVIINPNNPTGAVYPRHVLERFADLARRHDLVLFSDEIYEKILFEDAVHIHTASVAGDIPVLTFSGLSKAYRMPGYRAGWVAVTGNRSATAAYRESLELLASLRLCPNVPAQHAIQTSLGGYQSVNDLVKPGGRLREQRDLACRLLNEIPGVSCVPAAGAMYLFPKLDPELYPSPTTSSSSSTCSGNRKSSSPTGQPSTGPPPTTSGSSSSRPNPTSGTPSGASPPSSPAAAPKTPPRPSPS